MTFVFNSNGICFKFELENKNTLNSSIMTSAEDIAFHYETKRYNFGRPVSILEEKGSKVISIEPDPQLKEKYQFINPLSQGTQATADYSSHLVNTLITQTKAEDVVHKEGGWPQGIDPTNAPSCKQRRLKIEKGDNFLPSIRKLAPLAYTTAKLNCTIDLYSEHFQHSEENTHIVDPMVRTIGVFRDPKENRLISSISWSPDSQGDRHVAICYTPKDVSNPSACYDSYIYNIDCPSVPEMTLYPRSPLVCLEYNNKDANFLVGGMTHGSICLWDVRQGSLPVWTSSIEKSHRDTVYSVKWISSKTAFECVSCSTDGKAMTWDTRSTTEPLEVIKLTAPEEVIPPGFVPPFGGRCLDYHTGMPTKFMVGTQEGLVLSVNRKATDRSNRIANIFPGHYGPVLAVHRHPVETKFFASVSDWSVRVFSSNSSSPNTSTTRLLNKLRLGIITNNGYIYRKYKRKD